MAAGMIERASNLALTAFVLLALSYSYSMIVEGVTGTSKSKGYAICGRGTLLAPSDCGQHGR